MLEWENDENKRKRDRDWPIYYNIAEESTYLTSNEALWLDVAR